MKVPVAIFLCTIVFCSQQEVSAAKALADTDTMTISDPKTGPAPPGTMTVCCLSFLSKKIPRMSVVGYQMTSSLCVQEAVIFQTKRGLKVCADPKHAWVQNYIKYLEQNA